MTKVYPNLASTCRSNGRDDYDDPRKQPPAGEANDAVQLIVWKKSLLFNCNGFTVFDAKGNLVFRVDNYMAAASGEILLMDAAGNALLTIRRKKKMGLGGDSWTVYDGETTANPMFCVRKKVMSPRCLAQVLSGGGSGSLRYEIEGSFAQRSCVVYDKRRRSVVEILQKEAAVGGVTFGFDVFRMVVRSGLIKTSLAMALVILLDQMYASPTR